MYKFSMKYTAVLLPIIVWACITASAQETPQPIPQYAQSTRSHEWYVQQLGLWEAETKSHPANANAWYNRYKAQRYAFFEDTATNHETRSKIMAKLLDAMGKVVPNSWEYHLAVWRNGGNTTELYPHLEKAYAMSPNHPEIVEEIATYNEVAMNREKRDELIKQWYNMKTFSPELLNYMYNVLVTLEKNAILVTCGDNDTYPFWILQIAKNIRPDVAIMNTSLICHSEHRPKFLKYYGIQADTALLSDEHFAKEGQEKSLQEFIRSVAVNNPNHPLYISLTVDPSVGELIKDDLYLIGLANKYSAKRIDNIALLKRNWETMHLDYLTQSFYDESYEFNKFRLPQLNLNYVPPAVLLYEHYLLSGEETKAQHIKDFAMDIAHAAGEEKEAEQYFKLHGEGTTESKNLDTKTTTTNTIEDAKTTEENSPVLLMPNPASSTLKLKLNGVTSAEIHITDVQGKTMLRLRMDAPEQSIDISQWQSGAYTVHTTTAQGSFNTLFNVSK